MAIENLTISPEGQEEIGYTEEEISEYISKVIKEVRAKKRQQMQAIQQKTA